MKTTEEIAIEALQHIRKYCGKVCDNYELCDHRACDSSYGAWAAADRALREIREEKARIAQTKQATSDF